METELIGIVLALATAVLAVSLGELMGTRAPILRRAPLPGAVLGGLLLLLLGVAGLDSDRALPLASEAGELSLDRIYEAMSAFPRLFINLVFACLMLGRTIERPSVAWSRARPHIIVGHIIAWGQYVVGLSIVAFLLGPALDVDGLAGALIAIGFQGGHGTAAGLASTFDQLGFAQGEAIALAMATFGVVAGTIGGSLLASLMRRRRATPESTAESRQTNQDHRSDEPNEAKAPGNVFSPLTGRLTLHLALVASVIGLAWLLLTSLQKLEGGLRADSSGMVVTEFVPLFSVVLIVGYGIQLLLQKLGKADLFERDVFQQLSAFGLDMVIVSALATLSVAVVGEFWLPIATLCAGGLAWNLAVFGLLGPRIYPTPWYPYGMGDLGGGTATTATGLLLIRTADPDRKTEALSSYADKQPFYEPLMGGGLVTALALPTIAALGPVAALAITSSILVGWLVYARIVIRKIASAGTPSM